MAERDCLPSDLVPEKYRLSLHGFRFAPDWRYEGLVEILCQVHNPVEVISVNAKNLDIQSFKLQDSHGAILADAADIAYDQAQERAIITLSSTVPVAVGSVFLCIAFRAPIGDMFAGCYRSKYKSIYGTDPTVFEDEDDRYMISTQFQACEARRAFPCFDEPNLKASFVLEIEASSNLVVLSNMPQRSREQSNNDGLTRTVFQESPKMSTYLLAWAIGAFDYVEGFAQRGYESRPLPVRVYATRGLKAQCTFALDHAIRSLEVLTDKLGVDYPLPKCDLLAVHELAHGAMENWGLVTFRPTTLLCHQEYSDSTTQKQIAYIIAHELSHQWFGDLVTMDWWDDLWLNEGFATYVGWWVVDCLHPEWQVWVQYLVDDFQQGLHLDSLQSSHPVQAGVQKANEIIQLFDHISYLKGSAIIRMLSSYLGEDVFFRGVSRYLQTHQYGNARTSDLWRALSAASEEDINSLMSPWVQRTGYPLLSVDNDQGSCCIRQSTYTMLPKKEGSNEEPKDSKDNHNEPIWPTPITYEDEDSRSNRTLLTVRQERTELPIAKLVKLDPGHHGFYRTLYCPEALQRRFGKAAHHQLSIEDRIGLLGDSASFVLSGHLTTPTLLSLILQLQNETTSSVWAVIRNIVQKVQITFGHNEKISRGLRRLVLELIGPAILKLRHQDSKNSNISSYWTVMAGDTHETISLRKHLLELAVFGAHAPHVIAEGNDRWTRWQTSESQDVLHPDLLGLVLKLAVQEGGVEVYQKIKAAFTTAASQPNTEGHGDGKAGSTTNVNTRELYLVALARTQDRALILDVMDFAAHSGKLTMSETYPFASAISENIAAQDIVWGFIQDAWDKGGIKRLRDIGRGKGIDHWIKRSLANVSNHQVRHDMIAFFADKDVSGFNKGLQQTLEQIEINAQYRVRDEQVLEDWLNAQNYLD